MFLSAIQISFRAECALKPVSFLMATLFLLPVIAVSQVTCVEGNCRNGSGTCIFPSGAKYIGEFRDGSLHGEGILYFTNGDKYIGQWVDQHRQGKGRLVFANGEEYFGQFSQGQFHGAGEMTFADGRTYSGRWNQGRMEGQGTLLFPDGTRYTGAFRDGRQKGFGTFLWPNGDRYEGNWLDGQKHGPGTISLSSGAQITGTWLYGSFQTRWEALSFTGEEELLKDCGEIRCHGFGKLAFPDGTMYYGVFVHGMPQGQSKVIFPNGDVYEGIWADGAPNGLGKMTYLTGKVVYAYWMAGQVRLLLGEQRLDLPEPAANDNIIRIWAVVVGAAKYNHMPSLQYTDDDAYKLYAFLKSPEGGALPDSQLRVLVDEEATQANVMGAMRQLFYQADANDIVLFYFSGHGLPGAFLPSDYDGGSRRLEHHAINRLFADCRAGSKIVLADACHAGSLSTVKAPSATPYYMAFENSAKGTALMLSSKSEEYSLEDGGLRSGIFSHFLVRGLKGAADADRNSVVTLEELYRYVHSEVRRYTGNQQTPILTGNYLPDTPLAFLP